MFCCRDVFSFTGDEEYSVEVAEKQDQLSFLQMKAKRRG